MLLNFYITLKKEECEKQKRKNMNKIENKIEDKGIFQKIYSFFDKILPFRKANENSFYRVKSIISTLIGIGVFIFLLVEILIAFNFMVSSNLFNKNKVDIKKEHNIAVLNFNEQITIDTYKRFKAKMDKFKKNKKIDSVLIVFNSGGGSPSASDDMANYILDFKKDKKVYVYVQSICASGAYYIASAANYIYANRNIKPNQT